LLGQIERSVAEPDLTVAPHEEEVLAACGVTYSACQPP